MLEVSEPKLLHLEGLTPEQIKYAEDHAQRPGFEDRIKTDEDREKRDGDILKLREILGGGLQLSSEDLEDVLSHAIEAWLILNPLSYHDKQEQLKVVRFKDWGETIKNPNVLETNWDHVLLIFKGFIKLNKIFPQLSEILNVPNLLKTFIWHDATEYLDGDVDSIRQDQIGVQKDKARSEETARNKIKKTAQHGKEAYDLLMDYEGLGESTLEARLAKALDILASNHTFYAHVVEHLASQEDIESYINNNSIDAKYLIAQLDKNYDNNAANTDSRLYDRTKNFMPILGAEVYYTFLEVLKSQRRQSSYFHENLNDAIAFNDNQKFYEVMTASLKSGELRPEIDLFTA